MACIWGLGRIDWDAVADEIGDLLGPAHRPPSAAAVPDVVGLPVSEARHAIARVGLRLDVRRDVENPPPVEGVVVVQAPEAGAWAKRDDRVRVVLHFSDAAAARMPDYYAVLGVSHGADADEIHDAWRRAANRLHPDHGGNADEFRRVAEAYRILADARRRTLYDAHLAGSTAG